MSTGVIGCSETSPLSLDTARASVEHAELIRRKTFLRKIYLDNYRFFERILRSVPQGVHLELGSGGGFIKEVVADVITSDVIPLPTADVALSGINLPFADQSLSSILMVNVFHHIQDVGRFLSEASRCLVSGGVVAMIEPANTIFSNFVYKNFHHEPFNPRQEQWALPPGGRMSMANDALPWIVFCRDRAIFHKNYPCLKVELSRNYMPFRYILSGGVSKPQLVPALTYPLISGLEWMLAPLHPLIGMFMQIVIRRS